MMGLPRRSMSSSFRVRLVFAGRSSASARADDLVDDFLGDPYRSDQLTARVDHADQPARDELFECRRDLARELVPGERDHQNLDRPDVHGLAPPSTNVRRGMTHWPGADDPTGTERTARTGASTGYAMESGDN